MKREESTGLRPGAGTRLPDDISRCVGTSAAGQHCLHRDACRRYLEPASGPYAWYIHPQIPGPCAYHLETPSPASRSEAEGSPS
jgi:hypothetical protein